MRVNHAIIGIKGIDEVLLNAKNVMKRLEQGASVKKQAAPSGRDTVLRVPTFRYRNLKVRPERPTGYSGG